MRHDDDIIDVSVVISMKSTRHYILKSYSTFYLNDLEIIVYAKERGVGRFGVENE